MELTKRQRQIIEKAINILVDEGFHSLTVKKLAEEMNFSEPALYRHFKDKKQLLLSVIKTVGENMLSITENIDRSLNIDEFFFSLTEFLTDYLSKVKGITVLIMFETSVEKDEKIRETMFSLYGKMLSFVSGILREKKKNNEVKSEIDCDVAAQVYLGIIQSMVLKYHLSGGKYLIGENYEKIIEIYLRGVVK